MYVVMMVVVVGMCCIYCDDWKWCTVYVVMMMMVLVHCVCGDGGDGALCVW